MGTPESHDSPAEIDYEELYDFIENKVIVRMDIPHAVIRVNKDALLDLCARLQQRPHKDDRTKALFEQVRSLAQALDNPYEKANWGMHFRVESAVAASSPVEMTTQNTASIVQTIVETQHEQPAAPARKNTPKLRTPKKKKYNEHETLFETLQRMKSWHPESVPSDIKSILARHVNDLEKPDADKERIFAKIEGLVKKYRIHPRFLSTLEMLETIRITLPNIPEDEDE